MDILLSLRCKVATHVKTRYLPWHTLICVLSTLDRLTEDVSLLQGLHALHQFIISSSIQSPIVVPDDVSTDLANETIVSGKKWTVGNFIPIPAKSATTMFSLDDNSSWLLDIGFLQLLMQNQCPSDVCPISDDLISCSFQCCTNAIRGPGLSSVKFQVAYLNLSVENF